LVFDRHLYLNRGNEFMAHFVFTPLYGLDHLMLYD
jgi:hypothetical protein